MEFHKPQGKIKDYGLPVLSNTQVEQDDTSPVFEPGIIVVVRNGDQWSLAEYVRLDNNGCSQGDVVINNYATLKQYSVAPAGTADAGGPIRGIAAATIASQAYGWMYIHGYVEKADLSHTAASGEYLMISGSTAAKLTPNRASVFNAGTQGSSSAFMVVAVARTAIATGVGSISLMGMWG